MPAGKGSPFLRRSAIFLCAPSLAVSNFPDSKSKSPSFHSSIDVLSIESRLILLASF